MPKRCRLAAQHNVCYYAAHPLLGEGEIGNQTRRHPIGDLRVVMLAVVVSAESTSHFTVGSRSHSATVAAMVPSMPLSCWQKMNRKP